MVGAGVLLTVDVDVVALPVAGSCHAGPDNPQIFELDNDRKVIWEFNEYELVGNGLACWDYLDTVQATKVRRAVAALSGK